MCWRTRNRGGHAVEAGPETGLSAASNDERMSRGAFQQRMAEAAQAATSGDEIAGTGVTTAQMGRWYGMAAERPLAQGIAGTFSTAGTSDRVAVVDSYLYKPGLLRRPRMGCSEEIQKVSEVRTVAADGLTNLSLAETDRVFVDATKLSTDVTLNISATQKGLVGLVVGIGDSVAKNLDGSFSITSTNANGQNFTLTIRGDTGRVLLAKGDAAAKQGKFTALSAAFILEEIPPETAAPEEVPAPKPEPDTPPVRPGGPASPEFVTTRGGATDTEHGSTSDQLAAAPTTSAKTAATPSAAGAHTAFPDAPSTAAASSLYPSTAALASSSSHYGTGPVGDVGPAPGLARNVSQGPLDQFPSFATTFAEGTSQPTENQELSDALADLAASTDIDRSTPSDAASNAAAAQELDGPNEHLTFTDVTPPSTARAEHTTPPTADAPPTPPPSERSRFQPNPAGPASLAAAALDIPTRLSGIQPFAPTLSTTTGRNTATVSAFVPLPSSDPTIELTASAPSAPGVTHRTSSEDEKYTYAPENRVAQPRLKTRSRDATTAVNSRAEALLRPPKSPPQKPTLTTDRAPDREESTPAREATTPEALATGLRQGAKTGATSLAKQAKDAVKEALNPTLTRGYEPPPGKSIQDVLNENGFRIGAAPGHPTLPGKALGDEKNPSFQQNPSHLVFDGDQFVLLKNNTAVLSTPSGRDTGKKLTSKVRRSKDFAFETVYE